MLLRHHFPILHTITLLVVLRHNGSSSFLIYPSLRTGKTTTRSNYSRIRTFRPTSITTRKIIPKEVINKNVSSSNLFPFTTDKVLRRFSWNHLKLSLVSKWLKLCKTMKAAIFAFFIISMAFVPDALGVHGGRMGGSVSRSPRSYSYGNACRPSPTVRYYHHRSPGVRYYHRPSSGRYYSSGSCREYSIESSSSRFRSQQFTISPARVILISAVILYATTYRHSVIEDIPKTKGALGSGVSVGSLTVALDVPDRTDSESILKKLEELSESSQTDTRQGLQDLVSNVCLLLLRQENAINSAVSSNQHYFSVDSAKREFNKLSVRERSKFDGETINKYGGKDMGTQQEGDDFSGKLISQATLAVVTINFCIEGDQTKLPPIRSRNEVIDTLSCIASDVPVDDCLLSAEILWSPTMQTETLCKEDLWSKYPNLVLL